MEALQEQFLAIGNELAAARQSTHPQLRQYLERVRQLKDKADALHQEMEKYALPVNVTPRLREMIWRRLLHDPEQPPSVLIKGLPGEEPSWDVMQWLAQMKQAARAYRDLTEAQQTLFRARTRLLARLRRARRRLWRKLQKAQMRDLNRLLRQARQRRQLDSPQLPVELWAELGPHLQQRYFGWDSQTLLVVAEGVWRSFGRWRTLLQTGFRATMFVAAIAVFITLVVRFCQSVASRMTIASSFWALWGVAFIPLLTIRAGVRKRVGRIPFPATIRRPKRPRQTCKTAVYRLFE